MGGGCQVDVSFSNESGLKSARLVLELMEDLAVLRPLVLVIKYFLVPPPPPPSSAPACLPV